MRFTALASAALCLMVVAAAASIADFDEEPLLDNFELSGGYVLEADAGEQQQQPTARPTYQRHVENAVNNAVNSVYTCVTMTTLSG